MKSFLIIGMGTFGHHMCRALCKFKCEIMIADRNGDTLEDMLPFVSSAKICDCTNIEALRSFEIPSFDACFVCVNDSFQACLEITDQLKELGAKKIYSKADRELEAKFLLRCGADSIIFPERDIAQRIAMRESSDRIFDVIGLGEGFSIVEIEPPKAWIGRTIADVNLRSRYGLNLIAARRGDKMHTVIDPSYTFSASEHVLVLGSLDDIQKVT